MAVDTKSEQYVLCAALTLPEALPELMQLLTPQHFAGAQHRVIWEAVAALHETGPVGTISVIQHMHRAGTLDAGGGMSYISGLAALDLPSRAQVQQQAMYLHEQHMRRELTIAAQALELAATDPAADIFATLSQVQETASALSARLSAIALPEDMSQIHARMVDDHAPRDLVRLGLGPVDECVAVAPGNMVIVGARPAVGKTVTALVMARAIAEQGRRVAIISLEMSAEQLTARVSSSISGVDSNRITLNRVNEHERMRMANAGIAHGGWMERVHVLDLATFHARDVFGTFRRLKRMGVDVVMIDYVQMMDGDGDNGHATMAAISKAIKQAGKREGLRPIVLSQLRRRDGAEENPAISDLRECLSTETSMLYTENGMEPNSTRPMLLLSHCVTGMRHVASMNVPKRTATVFRVTTATGRYVDCTASHPVLTSSGYKPLRDITTDDSLALACGWTKDNTHEVREARFMGWMIGNGCMYGYNVPSFITRDQEVSSAFTRFVEDRFGFTPRQHKHNKSDVYQWDMTNSHTGNRTKEGNPVTAWLKAHHMWGEKAPGKKIPDWFMAEADEMSVCSLLAGLWETDGSVVMGQTPSLQYSSTSLALCNQILHLLARIGVIAHIDNGRMNATAKYPCYRIRIASMEQVARFRDRITLAGEKGMKLNGLKTDGKRSNHGDRLGRDTTLEIAAIVNPIAPRGLRVQTHGGRRLTLPRLREICRHYPSLLRQYHWLSQGLYWDPVVSIEEIGERPVFDRAVPGTNNFTVNGIVVHNSGQLEADGDIIILLGRKKGEAAIKVEVAKHKFGPVGYWVLQFDLSRQSFGPEIRISSSSLPSTPAANGQRELPPELDSPF